MSTRDDYFMGLALEEARKGIGRTSPNPCVGAVIVKGGTIIGTGYHEKAGCPHAEINALEVAGKNAVGAEMYVTLEPCNHYGKTPPCSHAVAEAGIKRVIVGMRDPNPLVDGSGLDYLRDQGIEVAWGVREQQCRDLNRAFIKYITTGLPLVVLKAGLSLDGRLSYQKGSGGTITGQESLREVHQLRNTYDAILVGAGTVVSDNPKLTTRLPAGNGRNPVRMVVDTNLSIPLEAKIVQEREEANTWLFCSRSVSMEKAEQLRHHGVRIFPIERGGDGRIDLEALLKLAAEQGITSILVEGGAMVHGAFLRRRLVDYAYLFYAPIIAGDGGVSLVSEMSVAGGKKDAAKLAELSIKRFGEDILIAGRVVYPEDGGQISRPDA